MAQGSLLVNDVGGTERDTFIRAILDKAAVITRNIVRQVAQEWHVHGAEPAVLARLLGVFHVGEVAVNGAADQLRVELLEFAGFVAELADLSRAHKGKVQRVEKQAHVLAYGKSKRDWCEWKYL